MFKGNILSCKDIKVPAAEAHLAEGQFLIVVQT
jgi:hypothetical protein